MHAANKWMAAAVVAAAMTLGSAGSVSAQGAGGGGGAQAPADPPAVAYRKAMMNTNTQHMAALRALLTGNLGYTDDIMLHTEALEANGKMFAHIFPAGSTAPTSRAMDEIWTKSDEFAARVKAFADATAALDEVAEKHDNAATLAALQTVQGTCGACHMPFRKPPPAAR